MTFKDLDRKVLGRTEIPEEKARPTNTRDGQKSHEQPASTDAGQAIKPSDDDDLFDNMPV